MSQRNALCACMSRVVPFLCALVTFLAVQADARAEEREPVVILVSIDGFRADYLDSEVTPHLSRLAQKGVSAAMRPSFPTKTFPNHWTLVTGRTPDRHGIVANRFEAHERPGEQFTSSNDDPFWWNDARPIWVAAEEAGIRASVMFWPGANVAWGGRRVHDPHARDIGGTRPHDWFPYARAVSGDQRVLTVLDWMRRPEGERPRFVALYFEDVDGAGHTYGPDSPQTTQAVHEVDAAIGALVAGLDALGQPADIVVVSDHGMAAISNERVIAMDRVADPALYRTGDVADAFALIEPTEGNEAALERVLTQPREHLQCWRRQDIPARFRYGSNPRVSSFFCLAETGWRIMARAPAEPFTGGAHGYDNTAPEMAAIFIASGPGIRQRGPMAPFPNMAVAPLLRHLLKLAPDPQADGTTEPFQDVIVP